MWLSPDFRVRIATVTRHVHAALRDSDAVRTVFRKEMIEALRDRRTIVVALLLPVAMTPLVTLGIPLLAQRQQERMRDAPVRVAIVGRANAPALVALGVGLKLINPVDTVQPQEALAHHQVDALLDIPADFSRRLSTSRAAVTVTYDEGEMASRVARQRIVELVATYSVRVTEGRLRARGLTARDLAPIDVQVRNIADERRLGGVLLAGILPFFIALWAVLGGQYAALDLGVGEKERRTLDALLVVPSPRWTLAIGKFLAVALASMVAVVVVIATTLVSLRLGAGWGVAELQRTSVAISVGPAAVLVVVAFVLVSFLSSAQLALSFLARSIREAQQYFTPLYLVLVVPAMVVPFLDGWQRSPWTYVLPPLNAAFSFRAVLLGTMEWGHLLLTVLTMVAYTAVCLGLVVSLLRREAVVNRH